MLLISFCKVPPGENIYSHDVTTTERRELPPKSLSPSHISSWDASYMYSVASPARLHLECITLSQITQWSLSVVSFDSYAQHIRTWFPQLKIPVPSLFLPLLYFKPLTFIFWIASGAPEKASLMSPATCHSGHCHSATRVILTCCSGQGSSKSDPFSGSLLSSWEV